MARKKKATSTKSTRKFGGKTFKKSSCHTSKTAAKKKADSIRKKGGTARVVGKCVYKGPKAKKRKKR
jgi:hypothetical protein